MKLDKQVKKLKKRIDRLEKENQHLKNKINKSNDTNQPEDKKISRRQFLKKAGLGAAGLATLSLPGASALNVKSSDGLQVFQGGNEYLDASQSGVQITNTDLKVQNTSGTEVIQVPVYTDTSDLPNKTEGSIAYVSNDNKLYIQNSS